jgi:hypothetical protein
MSEQGTDATLMSAIAIGEYRVVKWWPDRPDSKSPATKGIFCDLEMAETVKTELEKALPHRRFAVEPIGPDRSPK